MRIKRAKLEWNVLLHDFNRDEIIKYNIFGKNSPLEIEKLIKKNKITTYRDFKEKMKSEFMYHYWSRTEYEIIVSGFCKDAKEYKIDVWTQIEMNFDRVLEYIIGEMKIEFKE